MSTKWQKSCIAALVTSPIAFRLFKIEQCNIKMMDQFLDRIWPYKTVEIPKSGIFNQIRYKTPGKKRKEYKSINIGIEIEYDGCNCQSLEKQLIANGAISFNSGWDGGGTNGSQQCPKHNGSRLRENRLRINGMKGLKSLYILLEWMKENDCRIDNNSGMHFHIDCRDKPKQETDFNIEVYIQRIINIIQDATCETKNNMCIVYRINEIRKFTEWGFMYCTIKAHIEFSTIEWRMGSPTLNYKTLALQILVAIHITECAKHKNKNPNDKYLQMLGEISIE